MSGGSWERLEPERLPPRHELGFEACSLCRDEELVFFLRKVGIVKLAFWMNYWKKVASPVPPNKCPLSHRHILWSPQDANTATTRTTVPVTLEQARGFSALYFAPIPTL